MQTINRIKSILITPKPEFTTIASENISHSKLFMSYVLPLALIPTICTFIGFGLIGQSYFGVRIASMDWGIRQAIVQFIAMAGGAYITAFVINSLAESNGAVKSLDKAFALVAYAYTPMYIAGVLFIIPSLSLVVSLAGLYSLYLLYIGLQPLMKTPDDKTSGYFILSLIVTVVIFGILSYGISAILIRASYSAAAWY
jgi:hypothetical protein